MNDRILKTAHRWIVGRDTGISSITIWSVMMDVKPERPDVPLDPEDFGRCWRLLAVIPEWRMRLPEVASKYPLWVGLVREWATLEKLYEAIIVNGDWNMNAAELMYDFMQPLHDEGMLAAGWERWGTSGWRKPEAASVK